MALNSSYLCFVLLFILITLNIYFFYNLNSSNKSVYLELPGFKQNLIPTVINEYILPYLPRQYKTKNEKFISFQKYLVSAFNVSSISKADNAWLNIQTWSPENELFPIGNGSAGNILEAIHSSKIVSVDNAPKGSQLKLLLLLENKQKLYFKPKRYSLNTIVIGSIYAGFDRHNSEVFAYYLALVMNFNWIAPATIRKLHIEKDIMNFATPGLLKTMRKENGHFCVFGKCYYCKVNESVCPDEKGYIEGAAILYLDKHFYIFKSPWRRSYSSKNMEWQTNNDFCKKILPIMDRKKILNLVDVAIFDFLMQNGDRHRYEVYKNKIVLVDNGKGLGNPDVDELDILAPLYQCCMISSSTWRHLELLSGGVLTETVKMLAALRGDADNIAIEAHYKALERRLLKVYATIQYCIGRYGSGRVFQI